MAKTQPTSEQVRFRSATTGEHILDTYIEQAEKGGRTLADLLDDLFDVSGNFASDLIQFRLSDGNLEYRVGQYIDPEANWTALGATTAYQIWLDNGNSGTEAEFLASLVGPAGIVAQDTPPADTNVLWLDTSA